MIYNVNVSKRETQLVTRKEVTKIYKDKVWVNCKGWSDSGYTDRKEVKKMAKIRYKDGWHTTGNMAFYVENGRILRGVNNDMKTVYPYKYNKRHNCYDNVSGCEASNYNASVVVWR